MGKKEKKKKNPSAATNTLKARYVLARWQRLEMFCFVFRFCFFFLPPVQHGENDSCEERRRSTAASTLSLGITLNEKEDVVKIQPVLKKRFLRSHATPAGQNQKRVGPTRQPPLS